MERGGDFFLGCFFFFCWSWVSGFHSREGGEEEDEEEDEEEEEEEEGGFSFFVRFVSWGISSWRVLPLADQIA